MAKEKPRSASCVRLPRKDVTCISHIPSGPVEYSHTDTLTSSADLICCVIKKKKEKKREAGGHTGGMSRQKWIRGIIWTSWCKKPAKKKKINNASGAFVFQLKVSFTVLGVLNVTNVTRNIFLEE